MIVVDANVAAKWFLPEAGADAAEELLAGPQPLVAPDLIRVEVAGTFTRKVRQDLLTPEEAQQYCEKWFARLAQDVVVLTADEDLLPPAIDLSIQLKHPIQDCLYLALARRHGIPLITADRRFQERAAPAFPEVTLLPGCEAN